jgi:hypothetical protein
MWRFQREECRSLGGNPAAAGFFVQRLGRHVEPIVGPDDGAGFNGDAREALRVAQRLENALPFGLVECDVTDGPVRERQAQCMVAMTWTPVMGTSFSTGVILEQRRRASSVVPWLVGVASGS